MGFILKSLSKTAKNIRDKGNMGGITAIYVAYEEDVLDLHLPDTETSDTPLIISQGISMRAGKRFVEWEFTKGTGKASSAIVGETDGKSQEPAVEFQIPKYDAAAQEQLAAVQNSDLIVIAKTSNNQYILIGTKDIPAQLIEGGADGGAKYADSNHTRLMFKSSARFGAYFYDGGMDGLIDGESIESTQFTAASASAATQNLIITWLDNTGFDGALANDKMHVSVKNLDTEDTFYRKSAAVRSEETATVALHNLSEGDRLEVDIWFVQTANPRLASPKKRFNIVVTA